MIHKAKNKIKKIFKEFEEIMGKEPEEDDKDGKTN